VPPPPFAAGAAVGLSHRLPVAGPDVSPATGFSVAIFGGYRYALLDRRLALAAGATFTFQRWARSYQSLAPSAGSYTRQISIGDFVALQTATLLLGRWKPMLGAGAGLSLGYYKSPENLAQPENQRATLAVVQGQAGLDYELKPGVDVGVRADLVVPLARPTLQTETGAEVHVFGTRFAVRLDMQYRF
jgi:hypothetical protein